MREALNNFVISRMVRCIGLFSLSMSTHPLPWTLLRFWLRFVAALRIGLVMGSGLPSAGFCLAGSCGALLSNECIQQTVDVIAVALGNTPLDGADFTDDRINDFGWLIR